MTILKPFTGVLQIIVLLHDSCELELVAMNWLKQLPHTDALTMLIPFRENIHHLTLKKRVFKRPEMVGPIGAITDAFNMKIT